MPWTAATSRCAAGAAGGCRRARIPYHRRRDHHIGPHGRAPRPRLAAAPIVDDVHSATAIERGRPSYSWRYGQDRRLEMVRRYIDLEGARVLDVGCGIGTYVRRFRQYTDDVHGIEVEEERVAEASAELPNIVCAVGEALPYPDDHFDLVFSNEVIEHVQDDRQDRPGDGPRHEARRPDRAVRAQPAVPVRDARRLPRRPLRVRQRAARELVPGPHPRPPRAACPGLHACTGIERLFRGRAGARWCTTG